MATDYREVTRQGSELLRKIFPEIPKGCYWVKIKIGVDNVPRIECGFNITEVGELEENK